MASIYLLASIIWSYPYQFPATWTLQNSLHVDYISMTGSSTGQLTVKLVFFTSLDVKVYGELWGLKLNAPNAVEPAIGWRSSSVASIQWNGWV